MEKWIRARYLPGIPLGKDGKRVTAGKENIALSRRAAGEGMVLLKNQGVLPLRHGCRVALFGKASADYVKGGGGSGDVTVAYVRDMFDGMIEVMGEEAVYPGTRNTGRREWWRNRLFRRDCSGTPGHLRIPP